MSRLGRTLLVLLIFGVLVFSALPGYAGTVIITNQAKGEWTTADGTEEFCFSNVDTRTVITADKDVISHRGRSRRAGSRTVPQ